MFNNKKNQTNDDFEAQLKSEVVTRNADPKPEMDAVALTIVKNATGGYNLVKVNLDSKRLVAGEVEILDTAESKGEAGEKFKILVVRNGIL